MSTAGSEETAAQWGSMALAAMTRGQVTARTNWLQAGWVWNVLPSTQLTFIGIYDKPSYKQAGTPDDAGYGLLTKLEVSY